MALSESELAALPVGTTNAQALARNAGDFDKIMTGAGPVTIRTGAEVMSLAQAYDELGLEPAVTFTTGLSITRATQTVTYSSNTYHANPGSLPFTTTGTFNAAQWVMAGNVAQAQLANSTLANDGAGLIGSNDGNAGASWTTVRGAIAAFKSLITGGSVSGITPAWATPATVRNQTATMGTTAGTSTAYTLTPTPAITAYTAGMTFWVNFHTASGASPTLAINGVASPPNLVRQTSAGAYQNIAANEIPSGHRSRVTLLSSTQALVETVPPIDISSKIESVNATVASSALTLTLNPTRLDFRSATLGSGTVNTRSVASAITVVVPNGATLGAVSGTETRFAIIALDNAGTVELAVVNAEGPVKLDEALLISTTAISGSATSASVIYSTTARTNVPFRVVGFCSTYHSGGAWGFTPSQIQGAGGTSIVPIMMHAGGSAPMYACRAWVNFNGTGTVAILAAGNVSSITDNGTGDYTVNFSVAMQDAKYSLNGTAGADGAAESRGTVGPAKNVTNLTASSVRINCVGNGTSLYDANPVSVSIFR